MPLFLIWTLEKSQIMQYELKKNSSKIVQNSNIFSAAFTYPLCPNKKLSKFVIDWSKQNTKKLHIYAVSTGDFFSQLRL